MTNFDQNNFLNIFFQIPTNKYAFHYFIKNLKINIIVIKFNFFLKFLSNNEIFINI
jgi:hypothetical protein